MNLYLQFSEIMDKISAYVGKQRKNSEGEWEPSYDWGHFDTVSFPTVYQESVMYFFFSSSQSPVQSRQTQNTDWS